MLELVKNQEQKPRGTYNRRRTVRRLSLARYRVKGISWLTAEIIVARSAAQAARDYVARHHHDLDANSIVHVWTEEGWAVGDEPFWFALQ